MGGGGRERGRETDIRTETERDRHRDGDLQFCPVSRGDKILYTVPLLHCEVKTICCRTG